MDTPPFSTPLHPDHKFYPAWVRAKQIHALLPMLESTLWGSDSHAVTLLLDEIATQTNSLYQTLEEIP
ncbi:hypothetical protein [Anthocerotibacter panamensis]|uniref:hypothetical protein n=1 Tax=Anthocerotibacter panamensis TaxID=2857077 RepID=UPI001C408080|nr:hypothetical protein [Anthocerotibacter panamensis]